MEEMYEILTKCQIKLECCKPEEVDEWQLIAYIFKLKTRLLYCAYVSVDDSIKTFKTMILRLYGEICDLHSMRRNHSGDVEYELRIQQLTIMLKDLDMLSQQITC